tara:strand:+ start:1332 stop:1592 length:261 start_codon:yes stop_codon:yes gene_type:complete
MEIKSWADLKAFANQLNEDQLTKPVRWWGDEKGGEIAFAKTLEEDYVNETGDGVEPISSYKDDPDYQDFEIEVVFEKGYPILIDKI